jgi:hypothetical protein
MSAHRLIVIVAGDPGGAAALIPVIRRLRDDPRFKLRLLSYRQATGLWRAVGFSPTVLPDQPIAATDAALLVKDASALLCATSVNGIDHERRLIDAARTMGVPSLALLDFWSNYAPRFRDGDGREIRPDRIAVMDTLAARQMAAAGFSPKQLVITGQPAFDRPSGFQCPPSARRAAVRARLGLSPATRLIVFASQPLAALHRQLSGNPLALGFDESRVMRGLRNQLARSRLPVTICLLPHPREPAGKWHPAQAARPAVVIAPRGLAPGQLAAAADVVVGMNSAFLIDCCQQGLPTLSLQPGLRGEDPLPTNAWAASRSVQRWSRLRPALESLLVAGMPGGRWLQQRRLPLYGGSATRVIHELERLMESH